MPVLPYLTDLAETAALRDDDNAEILRSVAALSARISEHFGRKVRSVSRFGSSVRDTCLPLVLDDAADVDLLVVFAGLNVAPQEYLGPLRAFVDAHYPESNIPRAGPGVAVKHGRFVFDLVPGTTSAEEKLRIPDHSNGWIVLDPGAFDATVQARDEAMGGLLKPTIRLMKLWNVASRRPFESFELEQWLCRLNPCSKMNLLGHFFVAIDKLTARYWQQPEWSERQLSRARSIAHRTIGYMREKKESEAEREVQRLFCSEVPVDLGDSMSGHEQYFQMLKENWVPR